MELREILEHKDLQDLRDLRDLRVLLAHRVRKEILAHKVCRARWDLRAHRVLRETLAPLALLVLLGLLVPMTLHQRRYLLLEVNSLLLTLVLLKPIAQLPIS
jgi:hypothetical protein